VGVSFGLKKINEKSERKGSNRTSFRNNQDAHKMDQPAWVGTIVTTFSEGCGLIATFRSTFNATTILVKDLSIS
jgi:hypothetical protein